MSRQSLMELLSENSYPHPNIKGIVDVIIRDENGDIVCHEHKKNMITDFFRHHMTFAGQNSISNNYVFINENNQPMHPKRTSMRSLLSGTWGQLTTPTIDGPARIWTYSSVFAAPPTNRTFQTVGIARSIDITKPNTNLSCGPFAIMAATVLSSPVTQTTAQTLEVAYRFAFQRN